MNPYKILKLTRLAQKDTITQQYRKLAKLHHPDRGGNPEKFRQIQLAYDILINDARRKLYNETGEYAETPKKRAEEIEQILAVLSQTFTTVVANTLKYGGDPLTQNIILLMEQMLMQAEKDTVSQQLNPIKKATEKLEKMLNRFTVDEGNNDMQDIIKSHIAQNKIHILECEKGLALLEKVKAHLKKFGYNKDSTHSAKPTYLLTSLDI